MQTEISILTSWENFYVIIGSSAAALTGLMFVAVTFIAGRRELRSGDVFGAFGTPTVVHFCSAFLIAAILSAPWQVFWGVSLLLGLIGLAGATYVIIVLRRVHRQNNYQPVLEDWLWHTIFPLASYIALFVAALVLPFNPVPALFVIAAVTVLFLFIGIHNSWDTVTYVAIEESQDASKSQD